MPTGVKASIFPYLGAVVATIGIWGSYFVARAKSLPDVKPFPITDITHCGIHFPEYIIFRIGLLCILPIFSLSWFVTK